VVDRENFMQEILILKVQVFKLKTSTMKFALRIETRNSIFMHC